jgi:hypothetical protein
MASIFREHLNGTMDARRHILPLATPGGQSIRRNPRLYGDVRPETGRSGCESGDCSSDSYLLSLISYCYL